MPTRTTVHAQYISFYNNFDLIFKGSEDIATKGIENRPFHHSTVN